MADRSLFERLESAGKTELARNSFDRSALSESVLTNVRAILNARQGCCETRPDYGMPDLNDLASQSSETVQAIARSVRTVIETFEPRLTQGSVRFLPEKDKPTDLGFSVTAALLIDGKPEPIRFDTVMGDDRHVRIRT